MMIAIIVGGSETLRETASHGVIAMLHVTNVHNTRLFSRIAACAEDGGFHGSCKISNSKFS
jgi:hypothetical protein